MNKNYLYETYMHTKEASACASATGAEMVRAHAAAGYSGIIITDHFFNGNSAIPQHLPWEERIHRFCKGYENALLEGKKVGIQVFLGWEYGDDGTEFLTFGLDKKFLLSNPDMLSWSIGKYFDIVHEQGGFISHAHPYREAAYIKSIRLFPKQVEAVEVINWRNIDKTYNEKALEYARSHGLYQTIGSDTHHVNEIKGGGMVFEHELLSIDDFIQAVKNGEGLPEEKGEEI